mmetsp:Transcript_17413/g.53935  ORF Transcript_17413/g.53935 Transcript_17413/m.53935 type:complete len:213 (-) Transcript_17413:662-1300(-)
MQSTYLSSTTSQSPCPGWRRPRAAACAAIFAYGANRSRPLSSRLSTRPPTYVATTSSLPPSSTLTVIESRSTSRSTRSMGLPTHALAATALSAASCALGSARRSSAASADGAEAASTLPSFDKCATASPSSSLSCAATACAAAATASSRAWARRASDLRSLSMRRPRRSAGTSPISALRMLSPSASSGPVASLSSSASSASSSRMAAVSSGV